MVSGEQRDALVVRFYEEAVLDMAKSEAAQRPVFFDQTVAEIKWAGEPGKTWVGPATHNFRLRKGQANRRNTYGFERNGGWESPADAFPEEWAAYRAKADMRQSGTPLEHLPFLTKAKIAELHYMNIETAEQLASIGEAGIRALGMGGRELVEQARAWKDEAAGKLAAAGALAEKAAMEERIAKLEAALGQQHAAPKADNFEDMDDDQLRAFLAERGANPRANAAREKLLAACRDMADLAA